MILEKYWNIKENIDNFNKKLFIIGVDITVI